MHTNSEANVVGETKNINHDLDNIDPAYYSSFTSNDLEEEKGEPLENFNPSGIKDNKKELKTPLLIHPPEQALGDASSLSGPSEQEFGNVSHFFDDLPEDDVIRVFAQKDNEDTVKYRIFKEILIGALSFGVGGAFAPIFTQDARGAEKFGIDLHYNDGVFWFSTANTVIVYGFAAFFTLKDFFLDKKAPPNHTTTSKFISHVVLLPTILLPLSQLYAVEKHNQEVSESSGMDEYMWYALIGSIPIIAFQYAKMFHLLNIFTSSYKDGTILSLKANKIENGDIKTFTLVTQSNTQQATFVPAISKLHNIVVNYLPLIAGVSMYCAYSYGAKEVMKSLGDNEDTSNDVLGYTLGVFALVPSIFVKRHMAHILAVTPKSESCSDTVVGLISGIEGLWMTFPSIVTGIEATKTLDYPVLNFFRYISLFTFGALSTLQEGTIVFNTITRMKTAYQWIKESCCGKKHED